MCFELVYVHSPNCRKGFVHIFQSWGKVEIVSPYQPIDLNLALPWLWVNCDPKNVYPNSRGKMSLKKPKDPFTLLSLKLFFFQLQFNHSGKVSVTSRFIGKLISRLFKMTYVPTYGFRQMLLKIRSFHVIGLIK